jgi:hypothetical protein
VNDKRIFFIAKYDRAKVGENSQDAFLMPIIFSKSSLCIKSLIEHSKAGRNIASDFRTVGI